MYFIYLKLDDEVEWKILKPEIFATIMDFFSSGLPILKETAPSSESGKEHIKMKYDNSTFQFLFIIFIY